MLFGYSNELILDEDYDIDLYRENSILAEIIRLFNQIKDNDTMMTKYIETIQKMKKIYINWQPIYELNAQHRSIIQYCEQKTQDKDFDLQDFEAAEVCSHTLERTLEGLFGQISSLNNEIMDNEVIKEEEEPEEESIIFNKIEDDQRKINMSQPENI